MFTVTLGIGRHEELDSLPLAITRAREAAKGASYGTAIAITDRAARTVVVVTDDANGITVHRLDGCPND